MRKFFSIITIILLFTLLIVGCNSSPVPSDPTDPKEEEKDKEKEGYEEYDPDMPTLPDYYYNGSIPSWLLGNWDYSITGKGGKVHDGFVVTEKAIKIKESDNGDYEYIYNGDDPYYQKNYTLGNPSGRDLYVTELEIPRTCYQFSQNKDGTAFVTERIGDSDTFKCYDLERFSEETNYTILPDDKWWTSQPGKVISKSEVKSITFQKNKPSGSVKEWCIDENGSNTVKAYLTGSSGSYVLYIVGDKIVANKYSRNVFGRTKATEEAFDQVESINFGHFDTSNADDMSNMFSGCSSLKSLDLRVFNTAKVSSMQGMFYDCKALESVNMSSFSTGRITDISWMFNRCSSLRTLDMSSFKDAEIFDMGYLFSGCTNLETVNISSINTRFARMFDELFCGCKNLKYVDVSKFDTSGAQSMISMFADCGIESINVSNFDTSSVTDMSYMFFYNPNLESLDLSSFDTSKVTNMACMFCSNSELKTLNLTSFNTSKVKEKDGMFLQMGDEGSTVSINASYKSFFDSTDLKDGWTYADGVYTRTTPAEKDETKLLKTFEQFGYKPKVRPGFEEE